MLSPQGLSNKKPPLLSEAESGGSMSPASFNGAVKNLKKAFGVKSTEKISGKCPACGASITGTEGETVQCPYCGTYYTFT